MDIRDRVISAVSRHLGDDSNKSGDVLYNGWDTLRQSNGLYIMGLNPGGKPDEIKTSVVDSLTELKDNHCSYEDECWRKSCQDCRNKEHLGQSRHQSRVKQLAQVLGYNNIREAFAANAIFIRSKNQGDIQESSFEKCWLIHQLFLSIVQPKIILCLGNGKRSSSFAFLRKKLVPNEQSNSDVVKVFSTAITVSGGEIIKTCVIGVRHPSCPWFDPVKDLSLYLGGFKFQVQRVNNDAVA